MSADVNKTVDIGGIVVACDKVDVGGRSVVIGTEDEPGIVAAAVEGTAVPCNTTVDMMLTGLLP